MKALATLILSLMFIAQSQAIEFTSKVDSDPMIVTIVDSYDSRYHTDDSSDTGNKDTIIGYDSSGKIRIQLITQRNDGNSVVLNNSKYQEINSYSITAHQIKQLSVYIKSAGISCPLILKINRTTLKIEKAELQCDVLSQVEAPLNEG